MLIKNKKFIGIYNDTKLAKAVEDGNLGKTKRLLEGGLFRTPVEVDERNRRYWTALMVASERGDIDIVMLLVKKGADVNASDWDGVTVLMVAASGGNLDVVKFLVRSGAKVNAKDNYGWTVAKWACGGRYSEIEGFLSSLEEVFVSVDSGKAALARLKRGITARHPTKAI